MQHHQPLTICLASLVLALSACEGQGTRTVRGSLNLDALGRSHVELVASSAGGDDRRQQLSSQGEFEVELEAEHSYAIAFIDVSGDDRSPFAQLVFANGEVSTVYVVAGEDVDLGQVEPVSRDDHRGRRDCHGLDDSGEIETHSSFLVAGEVDLPSALGTDDNPHADDRLADQDDDLRPDAHDSDDDDDGLCDDDGSDDNDGGVDDSDGGVDDHGGDRADLPYDVRLSVGDRFMLSDAFAEKGPAPAQIISVEMDGPAWRLDELRGDIEFEVTQADCDHEGNRDRGRDRIFVSWKNSDGSMEIDHLDLRYCD